MTELVLVLTTMPDDERAETLARALVDDRLAACVSVAAPMLSIYRWQGTVERSAERQLIVKTTAANLEPLERRLRELHPYELPEWIVLRGEAAAGYAAWIKAETAGPGGG